MSDSICNGCNKHFSEHGLDRHLRSTQNARCHNIYLSHHGFLPDFAVESDQSDSSGTWEDVDSDMVPGTVPLFRGDYFGAHYTPEEFQMTIESDDEASAGDADHECDEAEETAELEHSWEPPPVGSPSQNSNFSDDHTSDNHESAPILLVYRMPVLSHGHIYKVKYSDRFPVS